MNEVPAQLQAGNAEAIFTAALDLPPAERPAHLDAACGNNVALRQRIEALLRAHDGATGFLPEAPKNQATVLLPATEKLGDKIGHYRLREKIGEGGCGIVYVAEQEEPVRRKVALKVIKLGMDTREVVARFEAERQALALMDHPNIARVFDGGATDTGRPYFVLELVRGIRITDFCDQHQLPTVERLKLFIQVCHAIQHAHQKGIIHRDIKPSNILVSLHDDVPVPKVIDFGIAKAVGERLTDKTLYTRFEQFMGTPAYMSPEQAGRSDLDIDTRSDIYALGVLLYELLAGRPPFDARQLAEAGLEEMVRCIREEEPLRPSTRLSRLQTDELTTTAQRRGTEPPKLINLLRGDLDWIVMKCLEKNRTRRYEAADGAGAGHRALPEPRTDHGPSAEHGVSGGEVRATEQDDGGGGQRRGSGLGAGHHRQHLAGGAGHAGGARAEPTAQTSPSPSLCLRHEGCPSGPPAKQSRPCGKPIASASAETRGGRPAWYRVAIPVAGMPT